MDRERRRIPENPPSLSLPSRLGPNPTNGMGHPKSALADSANPEQLTYMLRSAFRQHGRRALTWGAVTALASFVAFLIFVSPRFEAYSLLRVVPTVPRLVFETTDTDAQDFYETYRQTQASLVTSAEVLSAAVNQPKVRNLPEIQSAADPVEWLGERLEVEPLHDSELLRVALARPDGATAQVLVNAVVDAYRKEVVQGAERDREQRIALLNQEQQSWGKQLDEKKKTLRELGDQVGTVDSGALGEKQRASLERYVKVREELTQAEIERLAAESQLRTYELQLEEDRVDVPAQVVADGIEADKQVQFYEQSLANIDYELRELRERVRDPKDVAITQLERKQKIVSDALSKRKQQLEPAVMARERQLVVEGLRHNVGATKQKIARLGEQETVLRGLVAEEQLAADRIGQASLDIKFLQDDLKRIEQVYDQVVARLDALRVESKAPGRVTLVAEAGLPKVPSKQARRYIVATALGILGFAVIQFVIFGRAICDPRIGSAEELIVSGRVGVLGTLPKFTATRSRAGKSNLPPTLPTTREYEGAVDRLRATLLLDRRRPLGGFSLAVSSAARREGKSTLAAHLAASAARVGKKVLLVDADLYNPSLHKLFQVSLESGLAQVVEGQVEAHEAIQPTAVPGLDLLTAGMHASSPIVALQDETFDRLVTELNVCYDLIVIDTPPVLTAPDALYVGRASDLCVLSVLCDESRQVLVEQAHEQLRDVGVHVRGAVLHGSPDEAFRVRRLPHNGSPVVAMPEKTNGVAATADLN